MGTKNLQRGWNQENDKLVDMMRISKEVKIIHVNSQGSVLHYDLRDFVFTGYSDESIRMDIAKRSCFF